jgi:urocanate hydratase
MALHFLGIDVDKTRIEKRLSTGYIDKMTENLDEALSCVLNAKEKKEALSVGLSRKCRGNFARNNFKKILFPIF